LKEFSGGLCPLVERAAGFDLFLKMLPGVVENILGIIEHLAEGVCSCLEEIIAGVFSFRDKGHPDIDFFRKADFEGPFGGCSACCIAVEEENDLLGEAAEQMGMAFRKTGSQRSNDVGETVLMGHHDIGITLNYYSCSGFYDGVAGLIKSI